jgi:PAS domain S-box-containing protein
MPAADPDSRPWPRIVRIRPIVATIGVIGLILALLFLTWATLGVRSMRQALVAETERQSLALLQSLILASQYSLATGTLVERLERETQAERARTLLEQLAPARIDRRALASLAATLDVDGISVWTGGEVVAAPEDLSHLIAADASLHPDAWMQTDETVSLQLRDSLEQVRWHGIGFLSRGGAVALWNLPRPGSAASISGVGELIQEIGRQSGINYIVLQAPDGIVFASRPLKPLLKLAADSFLVAVLESDAPSTREIIFEGTPVVEAAAPFLSTDLPSGMFRVGLSLTAVDNAVDRLTLQFGLTALLLILFSTAVSAFVVVRRSLRALGQSYREVETLTGRVLDAIDQAVIAVDGEGRLTILNPTGERWFGVAIANIRGQRFDIALPAPFGLDEAMTSARPLRDREVQCRTARGERTFVYSATALVTSQGNRVGAVAVVRDETDARAMALQVRRAERLSAMGQLAAGVAHEIRNPLNAIALASQQLKLELSGSQNASFADTIWNESKRLNTIVEDFLSLARPSGQPRRTVDLGELTCEITQMARLEADKVPVELRVSLADGCKVDGVADELRKAVWNLLRNALAATPSGGTIEVAVEPVDGQVRLTIDDTGSGIAPEALARVFEPWFTTRAGGTGLGLAITHRIVQDHGGTIDLLSPVPGREHGTRALVKLPPAADNK